MIRYFERVAAVVSSQKYPGRSQTIFTRCKGLLHLLEDHVASKERREDHEPLERTQDDQVLYREEAKELRFLSDDASLADQVLAEEEETRPESVLVGEVVLADLLVEPLVGLASCDFLVEILVDCLVSHY